MSHIRKLVDTAIKLNPNELLLASAEVGDIEAMTTLINADQNQEIDPICNPDVETPYRGVLIHDKAYNDALTHAVDEGQLEAVKTLIELAAHRITPDTATCAFFVLLQERPTDYTEHSLKEAQQFFFDHAYLKLDAEVSTIGLQILNTEDPTNIIDHFDRHFAWHAQRLEIEKNPETKQQYVHVIHNDNVKKTSAPKTRFLKSVK